MKLSDLPNWPVKKEYDALRNLQAKGFNDCLYETGSLVLSCDVEAMAEIIFKNTYPRNMEESSALSQALSTQFSKFLKLEKRDSQ